MASPQQQHTEQTAVSSVRAVLDGFASVSRNAQAIVGEFAKMSEENLGVGTKAAERLRDSHSLQEVTDIQSEMLKESYATTANHYRKIAELAISTPREFAHSAGEIASTLAQAGKEGAERAFETARKKGDEAANAAEKSSETLRSSRG